MKLEKLAFAISMLGFLCQPRGGHAYEVSTHAGMSNVAFDKSILAAPATVDRLGLTALADNFGRRYPWG